MAWLQGFRIGGRAPRLAVVSMAQFLIALDYSIMYVALPSITRDLRFAAGRFEGLGR